MIQFLERIQEWVTDLVEYIQKHYLYVSLALSVITMMVTLVSSVGSDITFGNFLLLVVLSAAMGFAGSLVLIVPFALIAAIAFVIQFLIEFFKRPTGEIIEGIISFILFLAAIALIFYFLPYTIFHNMTE